MLHRSRTRVLQPHLLPATCLLTLIVASALTTPAPARAANSIHFERHDYTVTILPTGDVSVIEHWQVHIIGDPVGSAYLQIYLAHTTGIDFGPIAGASGQTVIPSSSRWDNPVRRVDWTFPPTQDAPHNFDIHYAAVNVTHSFDIPYTIHGALGIAPNQAWFDWHFVTGRSEAGLAQWSNGAIVDDECTITLIVPTAIKKGDLSVQATHLTTQPTVRAVDASTVQVQVQHIQEIGNSPIEVVATFPRSALAASVQRQSWQTTDVPPTPPTSFDAQLQPLQPLQRTPSVDHVPGPSFLLSCPCILVLGIVLVLFILDLLSAWIANRRPR